MSPVTCSNCRTVYEENLAPGVEGTPCPNCGSTARMIFLQPAPGHYEVREQPAQLSVITYPDNLLRTAERLFKEGQYSIAVVIAHMACEISTEHTMGEAFRTRNIVDLEQPVEALLSGYNLANKRLRKLYVALTGDQIHEKDFWAKFTESAKRRNRIIHGGALAGEVEAEESLQATSKLVAHLMSKGGPNP